MEGLIFGILRYSVNTVLGGKQINKLAFKPAGRLHGPRNKTKEVLHAKPFKTMIFLPFFSLVTLHN